MNSKLVKWTAGPVVVALLTICGACAEEPAPDVDRLIGELGSDDTATRDKATRDLTDAGLQALEKLKIALGSPDPETVSRVRRILDAFWKPQKALEKPAQAKLDEIRQEHEALVADGQAAAAARLIVEYERLRKKLARLEPPEGGDGPEVHVVGIYRGKRAPGYGSSTAEVVVEATDRPIVLILSGVERVRWTVKAAEAARIERVLLCGREKQRIEGLPAGVPVEVHRAGPESEDPVYCADSREDAAWPRLVRWVRERIGLEIATIQGAHMAAGEPFVVGPSNSDWRLQRLLPSLDALHAAATRATRSKVLDEVRKLRFQAVAFRGDEGLRSGGWSVPPGGVGLANFTPAGPDAASLNPALARFHHVTTDPGGPTVYGLRGHDVVEFDPASGALCTLQFSEEEDLPEIWWPSGLAFDSKRCRLVVMGRRGLMHAYEAGPKRWSILGQLEDQGGVENSGLVYVEETDSFLFLECEFGDSGFVSVVTLSSDGKRTGAVELSEALRDPGLNVPQLAWAKSGVASIRAAGGSEGGRLIVVLPPAYSAAPGPELVVRILMVDPVTGRVEFRHEADADLKPR